MARLILSIFLSLPVLTCTVKTHITVRTVKEELNIQNVEHPDDGVIVRIIDPPQDSPEEAAEAPADAEHSEHAEAAEAHGHEEEAHGEAHADDHAADAHGQSEEHEDDPVEWPSQCRHVGQILIASLDDKEVVSDLDHAAQDEQEGDSHLFFSPGARSQ